MPFQYVNIINKYIDGNTIHRYTNENMPHTHQMCVVEKQRCVCKGNICCCKATCLHC